MCSLADISDERRFIVAGLPRSGTTFLYHNLQRHPDIFLPYRKETDFFGSNYERGVGWYRQLFTGITPHQLAGDISPNYVLDPLAIERLERLCPRSRIILGIRDPAELALSLYAQYDTLHYNMPPFADFIEQFALARGRLPLVLRLTDRQLVDGVEALTASYGERLLLYRFELLRQDPLAVLRSIEKFLDLDVYLTEDTADLRVVNSVQRRNIKMLSHLLSREAVIDVLDSLIPRRWIQRVRGRFDHASGAGRGRRPAAYTAENLRLAEERFADDRAALDRLCGSSWVCLGDGTVPSWDERQADAGIAARTDTGIAARRDAELVGMAEPR